MDTLLGTNSEEEDGNEDMDQDEDGDNEGVRKEVLLYFGENNIPRDTDPLKWWKDNAIRFSTLAALAKRASLTAEHVEMLTFLHSNA